MSDSERGQAIQRRLTNLGISDREFHDQTGIDRKTLRRAVAGQEKVRPSTYAAIESALDKLEQKVHPSGVEPVGEGLVKFRLTGIYGAADVVVEGPVKDLPELEAAVERLLKGLRTDRDGKE